MKKKEFNGLMASEKTKIKKMASILLDVSTEDLYIAETSEAPKKDWEDKAWEVVATVCSYMDDDISITIMANCFLSNRRMSFAHVAVNDSPFYLTSDRWDEVREYAKYKREREAYIDNVIAKAKEDIRNAIDPIWICEKAYISWDQFGDTKMQIMEGLTGYNRKTDTNWEEDGIVFNAIMAYNLEDCPYIEIIPTIEFKSYVAHIKAFEGIVEQASDDIARATEGCDTMEGCNKAYQNVRTCRKAAVVAIKKAISSSKGLDIHKEYVAAIDDFVMSAFKMIGGREIDILSENFVEEDM